MTTINRRSSSKKPTQTKPPLYSNKVYNPWYRRFVQHLPEDEQMDYQPQKEIDARTAEMAMRFTYGDFYVEDENPEEAAANRAHAIARFGHKVIFRLNK